MDWGALLEIFGWTVEGVADKILSSESS